MSGALAWAARVGGSTTEAHRSAAVSSTTGGRAFLLPAVVASRRSRRTVSAVQRVAMSCLERRHCRALQLHESAARWTMHRKRCDALLPRACDRPARGVLNRSGSMVHWSDQTAFEILRRPLATRQTLA